MEKDIKTQRLFHALAEYIRRCNEKDPPAKAKGKENDDKSENDGKNDGKNDGEDGKDCAENPDGKERKRQQKDQGAESLALGAVISENEKSFPNVCGFCRFIGKGTRELIGALSDDKNAVDRILTVFEDEAFRSGASSAIMTQYLKLIDELRELSRLCREENNTQISVFFPHEP